MFLKKLPGLLALFFFFCATLQSVAQMELPRGSSKASISQRVGLTDIAIHYSRPNVILNENDRTGKIWGQLVPYGMSSQNFTGLPVPWRAGANENTTISFSTDVKVEGKELAAGTYGFHIIPEENGDATLIFSTVDYLWGSFGYDEANDALRVTIQTEACVQTNLLTFQFDAVTTDDCTVALHWEQKRFPFKVETETHAIVIASMKKQMAQSLGFQWPSFATAINYCLNNDTHLEQALQWADQSISFFGGNFVLFNAKADVLEKTGKDEEAKQFRQMAMNVGTITDLFGYGQQLIGKQKTDQALVVFHQNEDRLKAMTLKGPMDEFTVYGGLAMGYNAKKNTEKALDYAKKALAVAPTDQTKGMAQAFIDRLQK